MEFFQEDSSTKAPIKTFTTGDDVLLVRLASSSAEYQQVYSGREDPVLNLVDLSGLRRGDWMEGSFVMSASDNTLIVAAVSISFGILFVMQSRPQLVEHGLAIGKKTQHGVEFWSPNVIGRLYQITRQGPEAGEVGVSPRMHWRRGHWRQQAYGPQHSLRRDQWIEPMLVAAEMREVPPESLLPLSRAKAMPDALERDQSIKADLLVQLARTFAKEHEALALQALDEVPKATEQYPALVRCKYLVETGDQYSRMGKVINLKDIVKQGMRAVKQLYEIDTNSDDPNQALKSSWPSTVVSRAFSALATKVSQPFAEAAISELPDPDLQVFNMIQVADTLFAIPNYPNLIQQRHKQENANSTQVFDMPSAEK